MNWRMSFPKFAIPKLCLTLALLAQSAISQAVEYKVGSIIVDQPWSRATPATAKVGGGYLVITNTGKEDDTLVSAETDVSQRAEFHSMSMNGDVMTMAIITDPLVIKPGQSIVVEPGVMHIMLLDLKAGFKEGQTFKGKLTFEKAGAVESSMQSPKWAQRRSPKIPKPCRKPTMAR